MNSLAIYPWQRACVYAILEFDPKEQSADRNETVRVIHERMKKPSNSAATNTAQFRMRAPE